ncbi:hypothetical protein Golax_000515 [Gossypium laxum]|uniref:Uncharacterized protein n=2 Tax=Gossypium TaxID=3633 RepID=A0A7J9ATU3_9ROSI|nr:hypothetical protein [Gossypium laxum]
MYKWSLLKTVSNIIGQVIKVDDSIDNRTRGNSARLAISIDLRQPLILKICVYGKIQRIEYKGLPNVLRALSESISVVTDEVETQHEEDVDVETPYDVVEAKGFASGIWVLWNDSIQIDINSNHVALLLHGFLQPIGMQLRLEDYKRAKDGSTKNGDMFPSLTEMDHGGLSDEINIAKVKEALDTMAPLKASARRNCSYVWRSLSTVWMDLRRSVFWQLGDGCNTKFWTDIWISELGPLIDSFIVGELAFKEASIYAMTTITREWNWDCFENELPQNFLSCIASI